MKMYLLIFFLFPLSTNAQFLTVCDVLNRLSELNGKQVQIQGAWQIADTGEWLWAVPACQRPIIRDGWIWKDAVAIQREDSQNYGRWRAVYEWWSVLKQTISGPKLVMATLNGRLNTRDHFKISRFSHLPEAYGYSPAVLILNRAENLQAVPFTQQELRRAEEEAIAPWPVRVKKAHP